MNQFERNSLPLTTAQQGLWVGQKIGAPDQTLNIAEAVEIFGRIDPCIFQSALRQIAREAETLRVQIVEFEGKPRQIVRPLYEADFPYIDVSGATDPRSVAENWMMEDVMRPLDLARDPLWISALFKVAENRYFWYHRAHHVILDGYSGGMIARRLAEIYTACIDGHEAKDCEFGSLRALVETEAQYRASERFARDRAYWMDQLAQMPDPVTLAQVAQRRVAGNLCRSIGYLSRETTTQIDKLGKLTSVSLPQTLIGLIAIYFHRVTGANDLVFGMPVSGRINADLRRCPGMLANAIAIRLHFNAQMTAPELFAQVGRVIRQSLRHQQYRYEDVRRNLGRVSQSHQIAWLGANIEPFDYQLSFAGANAIGHNLSNGSAEDLTVFVYDRGNNHGLRFDLDANPALYTMAELDEHRRRLMRVIDSVLADPNQVLRKIDILGKEERKRLLFDWNETRALLPAQSLPAWIESQAQRTPKTTALIFEGMSLSYAELNARSVREARRLIAEGVKPGDIVAVALPRSETLVVTLLAIMRSGAAFLPLDPDAPPERLAMVLEDAAPVALITLTELKERFNFEGQILAPAQSSLGANEVETQPDQARPEATAYVLYTSGSTGRPKGVEITHRNLGNFLHAMQRQLSLQESDCFLAITTVIFDIAWLEMFLPLTVGARVVIAPGKLLRDPPALASLIRSSGATHMQATPSLWRVLLACAETRLDGIHALVGGEALSAELASRLLQLAARVTQFYGPTETTVWSTANELKQCTTQPPPIGRPILNTRLYVLDQYGEPVPTGVIGELYIGGAGVAKGYLNRPQLSAERFLPDPFANDGERMYRSGDRVRWNADGLLEFVGRVDHQLKIRGHRVEPGEIETVLIENPTISEAAVCGHSDANGVVSLAAYIVAAPNCKIDTDNLRAYSASRLPEYMIPVTFTVLDHLPLTHNAKLDRKALPVPQRIRRTHFQAPITTIEKKLVSLWQQIFGLENIGLHDNFFELGGDSLKASEMIARFPEHFGMELPLRSLFEASTIAGLAAFLERAQTQSDPLAVALPLRASNLARPLFCIHPVVGVSWAYVNLLRHLDGRIPIHGLQSRGLRDQGPLPQSIEQIAADYLAQMQSIQPRGPYRILGWSLGGLIAHAIAAQILEQGQRVEFVAMMDSYPFVIDEADARGDTREEIIAILRFLGFHEQATRNPPDTMDGLADYLCREYDVFSIPLVQEILKSDPRLTQRLSAVTCNNLKLARQFAPRKIDADLVFFDARIKESVELDRLLHHDPSAWRPFIEGRIEVHEIECHHKDMLDAAPAEQIGRILRRKLSGLHRVSSITTPVLATPEKRERLTAFCLSPT